MRLNLYQWLLTLFTILARVWEREVGKVGRKSQRALPLLPQCLFLRDIAFSGVLSFQRFFNF